MLNGSSATPETVQHAPSLTFDGDNSYPDCEKCGSCCQIAVLSITPDELTTMHACIEDEGIIPVDRGYDMCPLRSEEGTCMIWDARPQICRLYNCQVFRRDIMDEKPDIELESGTTLVVLRDEFVKDPTPIDLDSLTYQRSDD